VRAVEVYMLAVGVRNTRLYGSSAKHKMNYTTHLLALNCVLVM